MLALDGDKRDLDEDAAHAAGDFKTTHSYMQSDMTSYHMVAVDGQTYAVQTIYDCRKQQHRIAFHVVVSSEGVHRLELLDEFVVR